MRTVQDDIGQDDDAAPVEMLASLFEARDWPYEYIGEDEISAEVKGSWTTYQFQAIWRPEDRVLQLLCLPEIRVTEPKRTALYEALALINEQLWLGHFDVWSNGGVILYRHGLMLGDDGLLGPSQAQMIVEAAIEECDRFYPVFQFILWGDKTPAEALAAALVDAAGEA
ncbi:YbjN domain-containing protein [Novosphingobium album (ex Liu et al. 2023)]|uniref:YbjN domain-containing protein n=1 Tax=Novosphingobium album (ex Liu et al. 2023) TaxID=3031130 RepID=A0ABT5WK44_9SPHN|nr:YbjN domain-containing protein [Novosphingobium album (ex Liu et al. 2023)]MDE8650405.1 YbjN domain-containing protein [Novosphingobium album (ex Liu et al. 2023)]